MIQITMPRLSDTMEEGTIASWHKQPGDTVEVGEPLVEIETDKALMDFEAYDSGVLATILVPEGESVAIGTPIAEIDDGSGDSASPDDTTKSAAPTAAAREPVAPEPTETVTAPADVPSTVPSTAPSDEGERGQADRLIATPLVRTIARENGIDLRQVRGSGPGGRIVKRDVQALLEARTDAPAPAPAPARESATPAPASTVDQPAGGLDERRGSEEVPLSSTRRVIARRLGESARTTPHFYVTAVADAEELMRLRAELNAQLTDAGRPKISVNDLLIRACAIALTQHPQVNASYQGDDAGTMLIHHRVNIGVAVASDNGLVVPVIDDADHKTVTQLGAEAKALIALANERKLTPAQMSGGTFTISNLGMLGVDQFTAIINAPEGAILAVGATRREPAVVGDEIVPRYRMRYTLSADHRIIDGALAAQFLQTLTSLIEHPWTIIA